MTRSSFGSIQERSPGCWRVRWSVTVDGKRAYRSKTIRGTRADAEAFLASTRTLSQDTRGPLLLRHFWSDYHAAIVQRLRPATVAGYVSDWTHTVAPLFGDLDMSRASTREIERRLWTIQAWGTQRNAFKLLRQMFNKAHSWELIERNPMERHIDLRDHRRKAPDCYSAAEVPAVLAAWEGADWEAAAIMSMCAGCRREEALALRWEDFAWFDGYCTARIVRTITDTRGGSAVGLTKTERSERTVAVTGMAYERLLSLRSAGALVPGEVGGFDHPRNVVQRYKRWMHAKSRAHVRWVPWMNLRHAYATMARAAGVDASTLSAVLGHADLSTAYRHYEVADDGLPLRAARAVAALAPTPGKQGASGRAEASSTALADAPAVPRPT